VTRARLALLAAALLLTACGPTPPFQLAVRAIPGDVAYGAQSQPSPTAGAAQPGPAAAALPPGAPPLIYGAPASPPAATFAPTSAATPQPQCPAAPVDAVPLLAADPSATVPPVAGTYPWHTDAAHSYYTVGGGARQQFPPQLTHTVANVSAPDSTTGAYTFDVATSAGGVTGMQKVTNSYQVVPPPQGTTNVQGVSTTQASGLYLTAMTAQDSGLPTRRVAKFAPPILLMQFPGTDLATWKTAGTDSATGTTITLSGAVTRHVAVDACGSLVDAWEVHATGTLAGPNQNLTLDLTYDVATQYGGILVGESSTVTGTEMAGAAMQNVDSHDVSATSVVPRRST
jgi:hypothetical protein